MLPKDIQDALKRTDIVWVGDEQPFAAWFAFSDERIYLLSQREPGPEEQTLPPLGAVTSVVTRRKGRETAGPGFRATVRMLEPGPEWEAAAAKLVDRRRSRVGPPADSIERWRTACDIAELTPEIEAGV